VVSIAGSSWGGALLKVDFVGRGMRLEFNHPDYDDPIITSPICDIRECRSSELGREHVLDSGTGI
jgi:hypothetical protein